MRRITRPPWDRAESQLKREQNTFPMCIRPLGVGANRPVTAAMAIILSKFYTGSS